MTFSPQSQAVYQILLETTHPLSAKDLAERLHVVSSLVYRLIQPLVEMGLVTQTTPYPYQFRAKPLDEGLSLFLLQQTDWFYKQFSSDITTKTQKDAAPQEIQLSFVQSRDELMNRSAEEIAKAHTSVDLLRSGHEIPADVMLEIMEARKRNVTVRMLIQDYSQENAHQVAYWQQNEIFVRRTSQHHVRLMLYDASIVYFMSYKHADSQKDIGVKITYPPFALILSQLFDNWWKNAEKI